MTQFTQIERSIVAIFDIEEFSERTPNKMAELAQSFFGLLSHSLLELQDLQPDAFSTGDGAIVSIGRRCVVDAKSTHRFMSFVIGLSANLCRSGVIVRTAINYSEGDRVVFGCETLAGLCIQVGDTINIAARALTFCEPREVMVTDAVQRLLRIHDLEREFRLHHNDPLVTKHGLRLDTYTYDPQQQFKDILYSPASPLHPYKRFSAFPQLKLRTLDQFRVSGLDSELRKVVSNAYDAMNYINDTKTFLSVRQVLDVLTRPNYDPEDTVYVMSRNDRPSNFWTQKRRSQYTQFLAGNAKRYGGSINQTRVMVYDDADQDGEATPLSKPDDLSHVLETLHRPGTLLSFPVSLLEPYEHISQLIFGFTLSRKHKYAIIPVPGGDVIDPRRVTTDELGELLYTHRNYDEKDGPMKAIITAHETFVETLIAEFENLLKSPVVVTIK